MKSNQVPLLACWLALITASSILVAMPGKGTAKSRAKVSKKCTAPVIDRNQEKIIYIDYISYSNPNGETTSPVKKLLNVVESYPRNKRFQMVYEMLGLRTKYHNTVFFDRRKKILKFQGKYWDDERQPYYQFYRVDEAKIRRVVLLSKRTYQQDNGIIFGPDTYFFLLAKLGCPVKDLRTGKFVSYNDLE